MKRLEENVCSTFFTQILGTVSDISMPLQVRITFEHLVLFTAIKIGEISHDMQHVRPSILSWQEVRYITTMTRDVELHR